jgi:cyclopropane fatty-acyl-phospholipid synthase-like methyltransferase
MSTIGPPSHENASQAVPMRDGTEAAIQQHYDVSNTFYAYGLTKP